MAHVAMLFTLPGSAVSGTHTDVIPRRRFLDARGADALSEHDLFLCSSSCPEHPKSPNFCPDTFWPTWWGSIADVPGAIKMAEFFGILNGVECILGRPATEWDEFARTYVRRMLNEIWEFLFGSKTPAQPPPLQRPRKYARTTDLGFDGQRRNLRANGPDRLVGPTVPIQYYPLPHFQNGPQFQAAAPGFLPMPVPNQANMHQGYYGGFAFNPLIPHTPGAYPFAGYPQFPPQNQWTLGFNPPLNPAIQYMPPNYPPPGHNYLSGLPFPAPLNGPEFHPAANSKVHAAKIESVITSQVVPDHSNSSALDWPTGFIRRESIKILGERKWKESKWAWRSNGMVQHQGYASEVRACLGVLRCASCNHLTRPKTHLSSREKQIQAGCTSRTCTLATPLVQDACDARTFHYEVERDGETICIWDHTGDHSTHRKPPGGRLSKFQEDQVDAQVMRKQDAKGHFNAREVRNRRPQKPPVWEENDGRAPDTVATLAAVDALTDIVGSSPPSEPPQIPPPAVIAYPPRLLKSYQWDAPNSCFFDTGLELWFRSFARWPQIEQAVFLAVLPPNSALATIFRHFERRLKWIATSSAADIKGVRELSLAQSNVRHAIFNRWKLYKHKDDYGCATTWLHHAIRDCDTSVDIRLHFGVAHLLSGACPSHHETRVGVGSVQDLLRINLFDLRVSRRTGGPETTLTDYFANCTPRILPGNYEGGTTVVHSIPAPLCAHPDCAGSQLLEIQAIETLWPKLLQINPDSGIEPRLPIARSFQIEGSDGLITYELIGTTSFDSRRRHWTSMILIGDTTFYYDDLVNGGSLVRQGPAELISTPDPHVVLWVYHRTSKIAKTTKSLRDVVSRYDEASMIDAARPPRPPSVISDNSPPPESSQHSPPATPAPVIPSASSSAAPFPVDTSSPIYEGAPLPEMPPPSEWCRGRRRICDHASGKESTVRCVECGFWFHVKCVLEAEWDIDPENLDAWMCVDESPIHPVAIWNDNLIGEFLMFKTRLEGSYYPARLGGLTRGGEVRVQWYRDNIYDRQEIPLESEFVCSKQLCADIAVAEADVAYTKVVISVYREVSSLRIPGQSEGARDIHNFEHPEISDALFHSRQSILDIIIGLPSASHPIGPDYEQWMATGGQLRDIDRANDFVRKFFSAQILPGDASLIDPHTNYVAIEDVPAALSEALRWRANILAPTLFQLVILRLYLRRSSADDPQIYFLTRTFTEREWNTISDDDPLYLAKKGRITRHMTDPELALQAAEESGGQNIPPRWCKIGISLARAAAGRIPPKFILASAYTVTGNEYIWQDAELASNNPKSHPSSPLSEPPADLTPMDTEMQITFETDLRPLKRKHEDGLEPEDIPEHVQMVQPAAVNGPIVWVDPIGILHK
ncbi:hypothetical protein B0H17DRAFT_1127713 [Mycena rosella]|uniref:Zinc finger PHD-type domain-containing protein n=1 Tax=Mycena rosella TaxID=1033263 RepID=A0AAD7DYM5_MYCRO|nr:hypothetical protein B0H17DRAFT_1127713 [Mycena rosella]